MNARKNKNPMVTDLTDEAQLAQAQAEVMGYNLHATLE